MKMNRKSINNKQMLFGTTHLLSMHGVLSLHKQLA